MSGKVRKSGAQRHRQGPDRGLRYLVLMPVTSRRPLPGQPRGLPYPAELHTDGALPPFSRASSPQKLASPTFQVPFWYTATPD